MPNPGPPAAETAARLARNAVDCLPEGALRAKLEGAGKEGRPLRIKLGIDPTAPDIHLGHTVVLRKLREFQDLGHVVVLIIGDFTARVGDPSGRSATRPLLSPQEIEHNAQTFQDQALKVLDAGSERLEVRRNSEWLDMPLPELLTLLTTTTAGQVLERDDFTKRREAGQPISMLELLYPVLQGYDSVAVRADVELGGTDQKFNLLLARDIQRAYGIAEQAILTMPILVGVDGERKMSKSLGNHIGVTESAREIYGRTMSVPDSALAAWYALLLGEDLPADLAPREAKAALARRLVAWLDSEQAGDEAEREFERVFVKHDLPEEIEEASFQSDGGAVVHVPALVAEVFGVSRSEARRLLEGGGVRLDDEVLGPADLDIEPARLDGAVLRVGKRRFRRLRAG
jgi:tyrosyl-tRNA synthetase